MAIELKLPEVGENVEKAGVVRVLVAEGDTVQKDQSILEIETEKATLEVPSNISGRVTSIKVKAGQEVKVGQVIMTVDVDGKAASAAPKGRPAAPAPPAAAVGKSDAKAATPERVPDSAPAAASQPSPSREESRTPLAPEMTVPAAPSVRRLAREIGVPIHEVNGSGPAGRITMDDIKGFAKRRIEGGGAGGYAPAAPPLPDFEAWGEVERQPLGNVRKIISQRLSHAWATIPHVHQHDQADVTELEAFRRRVNAQAGKTASKLTMTAILLKLSAILLKRYPRFNASYDIERQELVLKRYIHIGVAVDTPRGLLVPVVRDVDSKSARVLAAELEALSARTRDGKLTPDDMKGGTFTISNLGGIGGTSFGPIINHPEVAILGVARTRTELALIDDRPVERLMLPLCVAYDHRIIDGADGARFITDMTRALSNPYHLLFDF